LPVKQEEARLTNEVASGWPKLPGTCHPRSTCIAWI